MLYVVAPQEIRQDTAAAATGSVIRYGRKSIAKMPSPNPLTRCINPAPSPTVTRETIVNVSKVFASLFQNFFCFSIVEKDSIAYSEISAIVNVVYETTP